jgi:hypothetical protein
MHPTAFSLASLVALTWSLSAALSAAQAAPAAPAPAQRYQLALETRIGTEAVTTSTLILAAGATETLIAGDREVAVTAKPVAGKPLAGADVVEIAFSIPNAPQAPSSARVITRLGQTASMTRQSQDGQLALSITVTPTLVK